MNYNKAAEALARLVISGIAIVITEDDDVSIQWREGHLEHVAQQYRANAELTLKNYADDILVAQEFSAALWGELIGVMVGQVTEFYYAPFKDTEE